MPLGAITALSRLVGTPRVRGGLKMEVSSIPTADDSALHSAFVALLNRTEIS